MESQLMLPSSPQLFYCQQGDLPLQSLMTTMLTGKQFAWKGIRVNSVIYYDAPIRSVATVRR
jgi:hypothetical protein